MTPKNAAFGEEFPWLEIHIKMFGVSLHDDPTVKIQRMDEKLLESRGTDGWDEYRKKGFLFLDKNGELIAKTRNTPWWKVVVVYRSPSVSQVLSSLTSHQLDRVRYIVEVQKNRIHAPIVTIHKPPHDYTVGKWFQLCKIRALERLAASYLAID